MERGLIVALSANEETTLKRIKSGLADPVTDRGQDFTRLVQLKLVEQTTTGFRLTDLGERRTSEVATQ